MKVFKMNDTETVAANNLLDASVYLQNILGVSITKEYTAKDYEEEYDISPSEITDLDNNFCYYGSECESDIYNKEKMASLRISFTELKDKHFDGSPIHFTTEI